MAGCSSNVVVDLQVRGDMDVIPFCENSSEISVNMSNDGTTASEGACSNAATPGINNSSAGRNLRARSNRNKFQMKVRQKRQTMQSMTRPLKQWLCDHRGNPYPTKTEKDNLASLSQMTLVQVSNWFANARRRLKSTVKGEDFSWSKRVKLYNRNVTGNAELLSVSSEDSIFDSDEDEKQKQQSSLPVPVAPQPTPEPMVEEKEIVPSRSQTPTIQNPIFDDHSWTPCYMRPEAGSQTKYKQMMLQRYLSDSFSQAGQKLGEHTMEMNAFNKTRSRRPSGSIGSRDYEEMSTSSSFSYSDCCQATYIDDGADDLDAAARRRRISGDVRAQDDFRWKEISAAMALTSLSRSHKFT